MCIPFQQSPYAFPLGRQQIDFDRERLLYVPILGKRVDRVLGRHVSGSQRSFPFPMRQFSWDQNAVVGSHDQCLHLAPNSATAKTLSGYGNHTLAVIPSRHYWGSGSSGAHCHHTNGAFSLFCVECEGYGVEEASLPEFWRKEVPQGLVQTILDSVQHGAFVGQVIRERGS